jgi:hypothetical protein
MAPVGILGTAEILRDFTALKLEPRAFWIWNRKQMTTKNTIEINGRGDRIRTCDIYVPNVALYQSELHPGSGGSCPGRQS